MQDLNFNQIKSELTTFFRNSDLFTTTQRGVTTVTEEFDGDDSETEFTLTNTNVKNVRSVTVGGVAVAFGSGYTVDYSTATVTFASAPATGTDNVDIQYDYGNTDKIFPDFPKPDLTLASFPRIGFDIINSGVSEGAIGGTIFNYNLTIRAIVYHTTNESLDYTITLIKEKIKDNKKNFYYLRFATISLIGPTLNTSFGEGKVLLRSIDIEAPFNQESV